MLAFIGLLASPAVAAPAVAQATVETFDLVIRLGANVVSFARLAAFGLTHAVLGLIVWDGDGRHCGVAAWPAPSARRARLR